MNRQEVIELIQSARDRGEKPSLNGEDIDKDVLSLLDLREVILIGSIDNLIGADLQGADLSQADLSQTMFKENPLILPENAPNPVQAKYDSTTIFPEGFDPSKSGLEKLD